MLADVQGAQHLPGSSNESVGDIDINLAKESIQKMLESVSLNVREFAAFEIVGIDVGSDNIVSERISTGDICQQVLLGIQGSYTFEFSGILSAAQYNSKFAMTTDFELASLNAASEIINNTSGRLNLSEQRPFQGRFCSICKRPYKNITLRNSLRRHICKACGLSCCLTCCSAKVFDERIGRYVDVCTQCALTAS
jgi:hypothetical protein